MRGIDQTVREMWRLINRDVSNPDVKAIAAKLKGSDDIATAKNVFNYTWKNFKYRSDPDGVEHFTAPVHLLNKEFSKYLDCDDLVGIVAVLLLACKVPVRLKTIQWRRNDFTHIICDFYYKGYWIPLDPVKKSDGFGNQITQAINGATFKEKIYNNPMGELVTLEDNVKKSAEKTDSYVRPLSSNAPQAGFVPYLHDNKYSNTLEDCNVCNGKRKAPAPENQNIIMIGNKKEDYASFDTSGNPAPQQQQPVQLPQEVKTVEKQVPYPVVKTVTLPSRTISAPNIKTYSEFY